MKLLLWTMIGCLVLWAIGTALSSRQADAIYAGTIYGKPVSVQEYRSTLEAVTRRALLTYGEQARQLLPVLQLEKQAWDVLLLNKAARRAGVRVSDQELFEELARWPIFQKDNRFDVKTYEMIVRYSLGTTPRGFEEEVRNQLAVVKLMDRAGKGNQPTEEELQSAYKTESDTAKFAYMVIEPGSFLHQAMLTDREIEDYFQTHRLEFQSDPKIETDYLFVPIQNEAVHVPEADLLEEYLRESPEEARGTYPSPARRAEIEKEMVRKRARDRAADAAWEAKAAWKPGVPLQELGRLYQLSAKTTGPFAAGDTLPGIGSSRTFSQAAFRLQMNEISPVVETPEGFYLILLTRQHAPEPLPLEKARPIIEQTLREERSKELAREAAQNWNATVQERALQKYPDPLGETSKESGFEVKRTDWVKRSSVLENNVSVGSLLGPAFRLEETGSIGGPWLTSRGWVIVQMLDRKPFDPEQFEKSKERLKTDLLERKRSTQMEAYLNKLRGDAKVRPNPKLIPQKPSGSGPSLPL